jgi:hypothetical protein
MFEFLKTNKVSLRGLERVERFTEQVNNVVVGLELGILEMEEDQDLDMERSVAIKESLEKRDVEMRKANELLKKVRKIQIF